MKMTGHPDQTFCTVRVGDVAIVLRDLGSGFQTREEIYDRYHQLASRIPGPDDHCIGKIVTRLGMGRRAVLRQGERGWWVDTERMAHNWPRLPWADVTVQCQPDGQAQMSSGQLR